MEKTGKNKSRRRLLFGKDAVVRPFGGVLARALLGEDEKFGGKRGAIDFVRRPKTRGAAAGMSTKAGSRPKQNGSAKKDDPAKKKQRIGTGNNMYLDDGRLNITQTNLDKSGLSLRQYANYMKKNKKRPPAKTEELLSLNNEGTATTGMKRGGMVSAAKTITGKTTRSRNKTKPRGVGVAKRGYGKAMK